MKIIDLENEKDLSILVEGISFENKVVVFPTDTVWGIGCFCESKEGVKKIYTIKNREFSKPLILLSNNFDNFEPYIIKDNNVIVDKTVKRYFPGALTLIFEKTRKTPDFITSNQNTVGIRVPAHEKFSKLCSSLPKNKKVLATTSANISNRSSSYSFDSALNAFEKNDQIDFIILDKNNFSCKGLASTVAMFNKSKKKFDILRQGSVYL